jgi:7-carboxy-7-deazaguanine synthase
LQIAETMKLACKAPGVPEIFQSIQGEGVSIGVPSVFIRASLCNLHCVWCDTDYTWNWEGTPFAHRRDAEPGYAKFKKTEQIVEMTAADISAAVLQHPARNVVLTGGEPLLQQDDWIEIIAALRARDSTYRFEIETNGTLIPKPELAALIAQFNVSPKLANSAQPLDIREKPAAFTWFAGRAAANFKFVCDTADDIAEILALASKYAISPDRISLMPQGTTGPELDERGRWLAELCKQHRFRYSDRLQVRLWGSRRGV